MKISGSIENEIIAYNIFPFYIPRKLVPTIYHRHSTYILNVGTIKRWRSVHHACFLHRRYWYSCHPRRLKRFVRPWPMTIVSASQDLMHAASVPVLYRFAIAQDNIRKAKKCSRFPKYSSTILFNACSTTIGVFKTFEVVHKGFRFLT